MNFKLTNATDTLDLEKAYVAPDIANTYMWIAIALTAIAVITCIIGFALEKKGIVTPKLIIVFVLSSVAAIIFFGLALFAPATDGRAEAIQKWANEKYMIDITTLEAQELLKHRFPFSEDLVGTALVNPYGETLSVVLVQDKETEQWRLLDISHELQSINE
jgi:hypothetical protein